MKFIDRIKKFYTKHPIISNLLLICFATLILCWGAMIFLSVWTHHGNNATVPDVQSLSSATAIAQLQSQGFVAEISDSVYDERVRPGTVISTWPRAGATVKKGREVYLTVASYQTPLKIVTKPLKNMSCDEVVSYLGKTLGIKNVRIMRVPSQFPDLVISAKYNGKEIEVGSKLPITANVVIEVGMYSGPVDFDETGADGEGAHANNNDTEAASAVYE